MFGRKTLDETTSIGVHSVGMHARFCRLGVCRSFKWSSQAKKTPGGHLSWSAQSRGIMAERPEQAEVEFDAQTHPHVGWAHSESLVDAAARADKAEIAGE